MFARMDGPDEVPMRHFIAFLLVTICIAAGEHVEKNEYEVVHHRVMAPRSR